MKLFKKKNKKNNNELNLDSPTKNIGSEFGSKKVKRIDFIKQDFYSKPKWLSILKYVGIGVLYLILLLSFIRVPYVGAFFDSVFFSFLFGWGKYLIYIFAFALAIIYWFPNAYKFVCKKRNLILYYPLILFSFSLVLSGIGVYVDDLNNSASFSEFFVGTPNSYITAWHNLDWGNVDSTKVFYANPHAFGGLITMFIVACFSYISSALLIIIGIVILALVIFFMVSKKNNKIKNLVSNINRKFKKPQKVEISNYSAETKKVDFNDEKATDLQNNKKVNESVNNKNNINNNNVKNQNINSNDTFNLAATQLLNDSSKNTKTFELTNDNNQFNFSNDIEFNNESLLDIKNHKFDSSVKYDIVKNYINSSDYDVEKYPRIDQIYNNSRDYLPILSKELNHFISTLSSYFGINQLNFKLVNKEVMYQSVSATFVF